MALSPSVQNSARGREIVFSGTLTNTSATEKLFLNNIDSALSSGPAAELPLNANSFFSNVPGVLLPGETYADSEIFRVALKATAPAGDYRGTVTIRGGSEVVANTNIAATNFVVLSPAVDVQATDPSASEFGPDSGLLTISRSGGTDIALTVALGTAGTAIPGVDYQSFSALATIPAGSSSSPLTLTPIPNNIAQGNRTAQLTLQPSGAYNLDLNTSGIVVISRQTRRRLALRAFRCERE